MNTQAQNQALGKLDAMAAQSPQQIGRLFSKYGIRKNPTGRTLFGALLKHRQTLPGELFDALNTQLNADGSEGDKSKFIEALNQVGKVLTGVNYLFGVVKQTADPGSVQKPVKESDDVKRVAGIPIPLLAGISIIAVLILILIIIKNR